MTRNSLRLDRCRASSAAGSACVTVGWRDRALSSPDDPACTGTQTPRQAATAAAVATTLGMPVTGRTAGASIAATAATRACARAAAAQGFP
jgi:hypothetical protein